MTQWMIWIGLLLGAITIALLMRTLWLRYYGNQRGHISEQVHDEQRAHLHALGYTHVSIRRFFGGEVLWAERSIEGLGRVRLEQGDRGADLAYTRIEIQYERVLGQGIEMLCARGAGVFSWALSLREAHVSDTQIDERFILRARDDARLDALVHTPMRDQIMELREIGQDVQLTDSGIFLRLGVFATGEALEIATDRCLKLATDLVAWGQRQGPIDPMQGRGYHDALAEMDLSRKTQADSDDAMTEPVHLSP